METSKGCFPGNGNLNYEKNLRELAQSILFSRLLVTKGVGRGAHCTHHYLKVSCDMIPDSRITNRGYRFFTIWGNCSKRLFCPITTTVKY